jgi:hypothetical protein
MAMSAVWQKFWFSPGSARNLALARIVTALTALWILLSRDLPALSGIPSEFWTATSRSERWRYVLFPGHEQLERVLEVFATIALLGLLLGVLPRICAFLAGILLYHLSPLEGIIWTATPMLRNCTTEILALFILAACPCGNVWSVWPRRNPPHAVSFWQYYWPVRLIQTLLALVYFFSGYSKLAESGFGWAAAENMRNWLLTISENDQISVFSFLGSWTLAHPYLAPLSIMGAGTLVLELSFPLALFSRRLALILVPLAIAMHVAVLFSMNITVLYLPLLAVFVDVESVRNLVYRGFRKISAGWIPAVQAGSGS